MVILKFASNCSALHEEPHSWDEDFKKTDVADNRKNCEADIKYSKMEIEVEEIKVSLCLTEWQS